MNSEVIAILRVLLAGLLGAGIGFQRERVGKPTGLRTHSLIALGAGLFSAVSVFGFADSVDPLRVAAGVVTGVGFIGGGVIFRGRDHVVGLTTAASIWTAAAIGLAVGVGMYLVGIAATVATIVVLMIPKVRG